MSMPAEKWSKLKLRNLTFLPKLAKKEKLRKGGKDLGISYYF